MALTADVERQIGGGYEIEIFNMTMAPSVAIYAGAALAIESGRVRPLTASAGKPFIGFAKQARTTPRKINTLQNFQT